MTDDESMYNQGEKYEIVPGFQTFLGSMKPYSTSKNPALLGWCIDLGAGVGPDAVPAVPVDDPRGPVFNWLFAYAAASSDPAVHARVALSVHEAFDAKGWELISKAAETNAGLAARIAEARDLYKTAEAQAGPYKAPSVMVAADNLGPLDDQGRGTVMVTVGAPMSAAGNPQNNVDMKVSLQNGGKFESTGTAEATVKPGASLKAIEVPPGQVNVTAATVTPLAGSALNAYYQPEGPQRSQNLLGGGEYAALSARGADFLKYGQRLDSQVQFQGGYTFRDLIMRSGAISDTTAEVTADVYVTNESSTEEGTPEAPADAVKVTSQVVSEVADQKVSEAFDAAAVEVAVKEMQEKTNKAVTAYIVLSTPETDENRAFTSNHLIASESVSFPLKDKPTVVTETKTKEVTKEVVTVKESVKEVVTVKESVKEVAAPRIEAGTPVAVSSTDNGGLFVAGAGLLTLLGLAIGGSVVAVRRN
ncbi:hypothetical protein ODZ83_10645 [Acaricomes phytoseiuli]|uniref:hypothetical protein n=1 Tax=Acaricomes phytoseiuli TaxID=291968 RepID=UPI002222DE47|nr:hypothetical protein [Acaricomes phytoseiuli]MCW1250624.1 hypothetical protein [Acaricomes phytoseiuli]